MKRETGQEIMRKSKTQSDPSTLLYSTKLENLDEINKFLDRYQVLKLYQDQINYLNSPISSREIGRVINSLPTKKKKKKPRTRWILCIVLSDHQRRPNSVLLKLFHKIKREGTLHITFCEATITLIPKPHKDPTERELQSNFPY